MANNLRYLLEHFCLDGQRIDISSKLDEENAEKIEKINNETVPSINTRIDEIKDTDIPNINSRIDNINQKVNTINNTTIPSVQRSVTAVDEKADRINESVAKNTKDISTLSENITLQGNDINSINTEKIPKIEKDIKTAQGKISTLEETVAPLSQKVDDNTTNIEGLTASVNELTNNVIPPIKNNVSNLQTKTSDLENDLTELRDVTVDGISKKVEDLTTKVDTNTVGINTINTTSIPHLQEQIDNLSGGGTGSIGELSGKVEKNTSDISALSEKVETNTSAISTINGTDIPNLQNQIDTLNGSTQWVTEHFSAEINSNRVDVYVSHNSVLKIALMHIIYDVSTTGISANNYISLKPTGYNSVFPKYDLGIPVLEHSYNVAKIPAWLDMRINHTFGLHTGEQIPINTNLECNFIFLTE